MALPLVASPKLSAYWATTSTFLLLSFAACSTPALKPASNFLINGDVIPPIKPTLFEVVNVPAKYPTKNEFSLSAKIVPIKFFGVFSKKNQ